MSNIHTTHTYARTYTHHLIFFLVPMIISEQIIRGKFIIVYEIYIKKMHLIEILNRIYVEKKYPNIFCSVSEDIKSSIAATAKIDRANKSNAIKCDFWGHTE